ncbi:MAG: hypothetical protein ING36_15300 [Burkholderiales bacterium]|nr:hypothetical protein [Burkholderiales bacterium]
MTTTTQSTLGGVPFKKAETPASASSLAADVALLVVALLLLVGLSFFLKRLKQKKQKNGQDSAALQVLASTYLPSPGLHVIQYKSQEYLVYVSKETSTIIPVASTSTSEPQ